MSDMDSMRAVSLRVRNLRDLVIHMRIAFD
jgi:hypothetical protein